MAKTIKCKIIKESKRRSLRVRLIKAPLVDTDILRSVISARAKAIII